MIVAVRLPRMLAQHADGRSRVDVEIPDGGSVGQLIASLGARFPAVGRRIVDEAGHQRRHVNIYVGNEECRRLEGLATPVPVDTEVFVIGSIAGGSIDG